MAMYVSIDGDILDTWPISGYKPPIGYAYQFKLHSAINVLVLFNWVLSYEVVPQRRLHCRQELPSVEANP